MVDAPVFDSLMLGSKVHLWRSQGLSGWFACGAPYTDEGFQHVMGISKADMLAHGPFSVCGWCRDAIEAFVDPPMASSDFFEIRPE